MKVHTISPTAQPNWLFRQAKDVLERKINNFSKVVGVNPKELVVKKLRNRWGNVTKKGIINPNYNRVKALMISLTIFMNYMRAQSIVHRPSNICSICNNVIFT